MGDKRGDNVTRDRRRETGDGRWETREEIMRQETGDRRRKVGGDGRQEMGNKRHQITPF